MISGYMLNTNKHSAPLRLTRLLCLSVLAWLATSVGVAESSSAGGDCRKCHADMRTGFNTAHSFAADNCVICHAGDSGGQTEESAHKGLIAFPGDLASVERTCGNCHAGRAADVKKNLMHTGHGVVRTTRSVVDHDTAHDGPANFQSLGDSVADSMLRKQCASCHIGQPKTSHSLDVTFDRGGGCLACHINSYPEQGHPELTTRVEDGRCFGCHSRSGRISLSYTGLAEVDLPDNSAAAGALMLADRRPVERLAPDVHYLAGMSCIDCHTSVGLMGDAGDAGQQRQAVDIECTDCHDNKNPTIDSGEWPAELTSMKKHLRFDADESTQFLTTENHGTPLWHIQLQDNAALLHAKNTGRQLLIPTSNANRIGHDQQHERLTCAACHSQWAPQCFGCHMDYDADGEQWDHVERTQTAGRWSDRRWGVSNTLPALGVNDRGEIEPFVPGMIMTIDHPLLEKAKFVRRFAPLSPHTVGKARSCASCHRSGTALGLGQGELISDDRGVSYRPEQKLLQDGLPADAWTSIDSALVNQAPAAGPRPLGRDEIMKILEADISTDESVADE